MFLRSVGVCIHLRRYTDDKVNMGMLLECNVTGYSTHLCTLIPYFLGSFAKLRKSTVCFVMSVSLSAWNKSYPIGSNFMKFDI